MAYNFLLVLHAMFGVILITMFQLLGFWFVGLYLLVGVLNFIWDCGCASVCGDLAMQIMISVRRVSIIAAADRFGFTVNVY